MNQKMKPDQREMVQDMFDWLIDPSLEFVRKHCKTFVTTSDMHLVLTMQRLYTCLLDEVVAAMNETVDDLDDSPKSLSDQQVGGIFISFSFV